MSEITVLTLMCTLCTLNFVHTVYTHELTSRGGKIVELQFSIASRTFLLLMTVISSELREKRKKKIQ